MATPKRHPAHYGTSSYANVERALRDGVREVVVRFRARDGGMRTLVLMHLVAGRWYYFDARDNPELRYDGARSPGATGRSHDPDLPGRRHEGHGLWSLEQQALHQLFRDGKARALVPRAHRYQPGIRQA